jgi:hypothetical protein
MQSRVLECYYHITANIGMFIPALGDADGDREPLILLLVSLQHYAINSGQWTSLPDRSSLLLFRKARH